MRLYGGKYLRNTLEQKAELRSETRDAILYDIDQVNRYCRVKIQGTDTLIKAYYPTNWSQKPDWLKPGNAVKIMFTSGNRGRIELVGHGGLIPTPVPGGSGAPPIALGDTIIAGMLLMAVSGEGMTIRVTAGSYRIGGITYSWPRSGESDRVSIGASSATYFRYDRIVAGTDMMIDDVMGTNFSTPSSTSIPATPSDHISLGTVLVYPLATAIAQDAINQTWLIPRAVKIAIVTNPANGEIHHPTYNGSFSCTVEDQYNNAIGKASPGYHYEITMLKGDGTLSYGGLSGTSLVFDTVNAVTTITYTGPAIPVAGDSPIIQVSVDNGTLGNVVTFVLYDEYDLPLY